MNQGLATVVPSTTIRQTCTTVRNPNRTPVTIVYFLTGLLFPKGARDRIAAYFLALNPAFSVSRAFTRARTRLTGKGRSGEK